MRSFFILMVLANLGFLAWNLANPADSAPVMVRQPSRQAAQTLQLLSEAQSSEPDSEQLATGVLPGAEPQVAQNCISLGVFDNTEEADFLVSTLLERGMQARVELVEATGATSYRVYMPPFNSDTAVRQTLAELQANDIESFIISGGELDGGISLGVFSREELALGLQEALAGQGFATSIQELVTSSNEIWVTIDGLSQALLEGSELLDLLTAGLDLEVTEKPCERFASGP